MAYDSLFFSFGNRMCFGRRGRFILILFSRHVGNGFVSEIVEKLINKQFQSKKGYRKSIAIAIESGHCDGGDVSPHVSRDESMDAYLT